MTPRVSVVIPTRNGEQTLPAVLEAVRGQREAPAFELVAIDSASTDGTSALLARAADRVLTEPPAAFDHGLTRNRAIAASRGEAVVLLVQDAVPASDTWLAELTGPLFSDPGLAGTYARQLPRPEHGALTRHYLAGWVAARPEPRIQAVSPAELLGLPPLERYLRCVFDNVCSCVRRSVWERHPFRPTRIAEDVEWAREVLLAGHRLAYVPGAAVVHSHQRGAYYELARTYLVHRRLRELFGVRTVPTLGHLAHAVAASLRTHLSVRGTSSPPDSLGRALALAVAWPLGQYLGGRAADLGADLLPVSGV